jgi:hypothetical protein
MKVSIKNVQEMVPEDFRLFAIWEFAIDMEELLRAETVVRPVFDPPVGDMGNRILGTQVQLANGTKMWAIIENLHLDSPADNERYLGISLFVNERWFHLARRMDFDYETHGPAALASAIGLCLEEIFPITYDVSAHCVGDPRVIRGTIDGPTQN